MVRFCSWAMLLVGVAYYAEGTLSQNPDFANEGLATLFKYNPQLAPQPHVNGVLERQWSRDQVLFPFLASLSLLDKRKGPASFYGMRGKKNPAGFIGMRGKKNPAGFIGMRGKKASPSSDRFWSVQSTLPLLRELEEQRGQKLQSGSFMGLRGKKTPMQQAFLGMRGKKGGNNMGFLGVRGKKEQQANVPQMYRELLHPSWYAIPNTSEGNHEKLSNQIITYCSIEAKDDELNMGSSSDYANTVFLGDE